MPTTSHVDTCMYESMVTTCPIQIQEHLIGFFCFYSFDIVEREAWFIAYQQVIDNESTVLMYKMRGPPSTLFDIKTK